MQAVKFFTALIFTFFLIWLANTHHPFGSSVPALGRFMSPFDGFWQNAEKSAFPGEGHFNFASIGKEVNVVVDERLVPHVFADNLEDAFFAQGYLTAQYRLWQMDISTRATGGYLAEILGPNLKERDLGQRRKGIRWAAEHIVQNWTKTGEIKWIDAYTKGVNAYMATLSPRQYPIEFKLMGYAPEPWTHLKSAIFLCGMVETLSSRNEDMRASNAKEAFGPELFEFLYPEYNPQQMPVIPVEKKYDFEPVWKDTLVNALSQSVPLRQVFENPPEFIGSNNWAVSGKKTTTGFPILCNDPHLSLKLPSIWFEIQLSTPDMNAYGVSLPGMPGIAIGFNENIAWGETNLGHDLVDWYTIKWADEARETYWVGEDRLDVTMVEEEIKIKGQEVYTEKVKYTLWGPVAHTDDSSPYYDMAMQWVLHYTFSNDSRSSLSTFVELMKAKNYDDYVRAMRCYDFPPQNFVFAGKEGDIAMTVNGKLPLKSDQQGRFILDGSNAQNAWKGFIPMDQVPQIVNPERGFVTSSNQRSTGPEYPYYYNGGFDQYRGRSINRMLTRMENITPQKMMEMQNNTFSIKAEEALPLMLALNGGVEDTPGAEVMLKDLADWDYRFEKDLKAPAAFDKWFSLIYRNTFDEVYRLSDSMDVLYPAQWRLIDLLVNDPENDIFDVVATEAKEDAAAVVQMALKATLEAIGSAYETPDYSWQQYKGTFIGHMANIPAFGVYDIPVGGYRDAINAVQDDFGPSWRMIVQLGDYPKAWGVFPGGQSGNPGSKYYDNMILSWAEGNYKELFFMKNKEDLGRPVLWKMKMEKAPE